MLFKQHAQRVQVTTRLITEMTMGKKKYGNAELLQEILIRFYIHSTRL